MKKEDRRILMRTRREFLKSCTSMAAAGAGLHLTQFAQMTAQAQTIPAYRALVCVFLFGGNDNNNLVVPMGSGYAAYQTMRQQVAIPQAQLRPITAGGVPFGLHPSLVNLQNLYTQGRLAMLFNAGMLVTPTTKDQYRRRLVPVPRNLFSHSDQTGQWQTGNPQGGGTGWGGRITDLIRAANRLDYVSGVSVNGSSALLNGAQTRAVNLSPGSQFGLSGFGNQTASDARFAALQQIMTFDTGVTLINAANGVLATVLKASQEVNAALASAPALTTVFPNSNLGQQLKQVAQLIRVRGALGATRQIYFCGLGGFDTHSDLLQDQANLLTQLDAALNAFFNATIEIGIPNDITTFTESEFGRTGNTNANNGSDHAWGSNHMILGGTVKGGAAYGTFPTLALDGPDDSGTRGEWVPTTALDQYAATLGKWFGVSDSDLLQVFLNLANFTQKDLGFMT
jgi:uncharacterized protein (DUF1501 family)